MYLKWHGNILSFPQTRLILTFKKYKIIKYNNKINRQFELIQVKLAG